MDQWHKGLVKDTPETVFQITPFIRRNDAQSTKVLHRLADALCHRARPTYEQYSKLWTLYEWWDFVECFSDIIRDAVRETWTKDQLFQEIEVLDDDYKSVVFDVINARRAEIRKQLLEETHGISQAHLSDFDWKLKLVMSSDKLSSIQEPVATLNLDIRTNAGPESVNIEMDRSALKSLIASLEAANKALVQLKT